MDVPTILKAMIALGGFSLDKDMPLEERTALYLPQAQAIHRAARTDEEAAALIADGFLESRFAKAILTGHCELMPKGMQCDPDKHGIPRARGAWQVWEFCKATTPEGEARCVLGTMRMGIARCGTWEGAFSALAGRGGCNWVGAPRRVQLMRQVLAGTAKR